MAHFRPHPALSYRDLLLICRSVAMTDAPGSGDARDDKSDDACAELLFPDYLKLMRRFGGSR
jgi:hypothetical protein